MVSRLKDDVRRVVEEMSEAKMKGEEDTRGLMDKHESSMKE